MQIRRRFSPLSCTLFQVDIFRTVVYNRPIGFHITDGERRDTAVECGGVNADRLGKISLKTGFAFFVGIANKRQPPDEKERIL